MRKARARRHDAHRCMNGRDSRRRARSRRNGKRENAERVARKKSETTDDSLAALNVQSRAARCISRARLFIRETSFLIRAAAKETTARGGTVDALRTRTRHCLGNGEKNATAAGGARNSRAGLCATHAKTRKTRRR